MNTRIFVFILCSAFSHITPASTIAPCDMGEIVVVECVLEKSQKTLSICASKDGKSAQYKFSNKTTTELRVDFSAASPVFRWMNSDTYVTFFGFINDKHTYLIGIPQETLNAKSFLMVQKSHLPQDLNAIRFCTTNSFGHKKWSSNAIKDVGEKILSEDYLFKPY